MYLIGISGLSGSGKSTAAALLSMCYYQVLSFADFIRRDIHATAEQYRNDPKLPRPPFPTPLISTAFSRCVHMRYNPRTAYLFSKPTPSGLRALLQWWGDWKRETNPTVWVDQMRKALLPLSHVVIDDVRLEAEHTLVREFNGLRIHIDRQVRKKMGPKTLTFHPTELTSHRLPHDILITNNSSIQDLATSLKRLLILT